MAFSSASKVSRLLVGREVAALAAPAGDRAGDAADHLLDRALALGRGHAAAEVLLRDDVRRVLRPELRELDVSLLERGAAPAGDQRVADLPLDLVERVAARDREVAGAARRSPPRRRRCSPPRRCSPWVPAVPASRLPSVPPGLIRPSRLSHPRCGSGLGILGGLSDGQPAASRSAEKPQFAGFSRWASTGVYRSGSRVRSGRAPPTGPRRGRPRALPRRASGGSGSRPRRRRRAAREAAEDDQGQRHGGGVLGVGRRPVGRGAAALVGPAGVAARVPRSRCRSSQPCPSRRSSSSSASGWSSAASWSSSRSAWSPARSSSSRRRRRCRRGRVPPRPGSGWLRFATRRRGGCRPWRSSSRAGRRAGS